MKWCAVKTEKIRIQDRPVWVLRPDAQTDRAVVFYHGWSSRGELNLFRAMTLAAHGYLVLVPEAVHHGERGILDYDESEVVARHMFAVIDQSTDEFSDLADWLKNESMHKILVTGHSMGGFTAASVFAAYPEVDICVNMNGSFAFHDASEGMFAKAAPEKVPALREAFVPYRKDPQHLEDRLVNRPILLLSGGADTVIEADWQKVFYERLREKYADKDRIRRIVYEHLGHFVTTNMLEELLAFAGRHWGDEA